LKFCAIKEIHKPKLIKLSIELPANNESAYYVGGSLLEQAANATHNSYKIDFFK